MSQNDYMFYSLKLINNKTVQSTLQNDPPSTFNERTNGIIIQDTSLWKMCIAKADFRGKFDLPLFIPKIKSGNLSETIYVISLLLNVECTINGNNQSTSLISSTPLIYIPFDESILGPSINTKQMDDPYYYVYDFSHLALMINNAFETIMADLNNQFKAWYATYDSVSTVSLNTKTPVCEYNNEKFDIYFDKNGWGNSPTSSLPQKENFNLYFDTNLWGLLNEYPHKLNKDSQYKLSEAHQFNYVEILVKDAFNNNIIFNNTTYIKVSQYNSTIDFIMPASSLQFTTTNIAVYPQIQGGVLTIEDNNAVNNETENIEYVDMITEISIYGRVNGALTYDPTNYRFLSMMKSQISNIQISLWWKNRFTGSRLPLKMGNNAQIDLLLLFQRKYI